MERAFEKRPWLLPVALFALTVVFLKAVIFPGSADAGLDGHDFQNLFYPLHEYIRNTLLAGEWPLWNPHQFIGHPIVGNPHAALFYPATWFMWLVGVVRGMDLSMVSHVWLGAWGMATLLRRFKATFIGSLLAGVVYAMSGWAAARFYAGHYNLFTVFGWIPWMLVAYQWALARGTWRALLPGMAAIGLSLLAGYPPMVLYGGIALVALWVYHIAQADPDWPHVWRAAWYSGWRLTALVVGGLILGAALVLPAAELTSLSARSDTDLSFANSFALPPAQFISLALPDFFGNPKVPPYYYWGSDFYEEFTAYAGVLPLLAVLLAIPIALRQRHHASWLFLGLIAFGLAMSVGLEGAVMPILWRWIPDFTSFRAPGRGLYFVVIGMAGLTALLVSTLQTVDLEQRRDILQFAVRRGLPLAAVGAFVGAVYFSGWYASASHVEPMPLRAFLISGVLASAGFLLLGVWLISWLWTRAEPQAARWALLLTCVFVILDAWHVGYPVITVSPLQEDPLWAGARINVPTGADARVTTSGLGSENFASVTGHLNVNGYDPLPVETYRKLQALADPTDPTTPVNTLLGVKYYLTAKPYDKPNFKLIGIADGGDYYQRTDAFPRAWIAQTASVEPNDDAVRQHIMSGKENLQATVYIDHAVDCPTAGGTAAITSYKTNDVEIHTSGAGGLLTLSDQFYPGWQATVDGQPTAIVRADTVFRAVCVPAGDHVVDFAYRPLSFFIGVGVSAAGWLIWFALMIWWIIRRKPVSASAA